jgi:hypothetical protein
MPQAASSLSPHQSRAGGGFLSGPNDAGKEGEAEHPLCDQLLCALKAAPVVDLSVIVGSQQAQDKHAARD